MLRDSPSEMWEKIPQAVNQRESTAMIETLLAERTNPTVADLAVPACKDLHWGETR